ncbi:MAG: hypothetical protein NWE76_10295, partial [Candidatus Bathyarchaeota archaeon]|nr:hypothetical protein [Candidatus Bathyarchaeota archaeon]
WQTLERPQVSEWSSFAEPQEHKGISISDIRFVKLPAQDGACMQEKRDLHSALDDRLRLKSQVGMYSFSKRSRQTINSPRIR